jgi:hypothetical protein
MFALLKRVVLGTAVCAALSFGAPIFSSNFDLGSPLPAPGGPNNFVTYTTGGTVSNVWTVTGTGVDHAGSYWQSAPGSIYSVDLSSTASGGLTTNVSGFTPGSQYVLSFYLSGNPEWKAPWASSIPSTAIKTVGVSVGPNSTSYQFDTTSTTTSNMGWVLQSFLFTANNSSMQVSFQDQSGPGWFGAVIAGVQINNYEAPPPGVIPEPATMGLLGGALLGLALWRRRTAR